MDYINENIENMFSLWEKIGQQSDLHHRGKHFSYSLAEKGEWPNKIWLNDPMSKSHLEEVIRYMKDASKSLTLPLFQVLENAGDTKGLEIDSRLKLASTQTGMIKEVAPIDRTEGDLAVKLVQTSEEAELWSELFQKAFQYEIHPEVLLLNDTNTTFHIAYINNQSAGTFNLHRTGDFLGIHSMGVIPEHRGNGLAKQIMEYIISSDHASDARFLTLQASEMGKGLYEKFGFQAQFLMYNYQLGEENS